MTIRLLTPEQARAAGAALERATELLRTLARQLRALAGIVRAAALRIRDSLQQARPARTPLARPAWQSPYGPPQPRR